MYDVEQVLERVDGLAELDGWRSRKASLKIQKVATGNPLPAGVQRSMRGMTADERQRYARILMKKARAKAIQTRQTKEFNHKRKQAMIQRQAMNNKLLRKFKEQKMNEARQKQVAMAKAKIAGKIAQKNAEANRALAVRNSTNPSIIQSNAERIRVARAQAFGRQITDHDVAFRAFPVGPTSTPIEPSIDEMAGLGYSSSRKRIPYRSRKRIPYRNTTRPRPISSKRDKTGLPIPQRSVMSQRNIEAKRVALARGRMMNARRTPRGITSYTSRDRNNIAPTIQRISEAIARLRNSKNKYAQVHAQKLQKKLNVVRKSIRSTNRTTGYRQMNGLGSASDSLSPFEQQFLGVGEVDMQRALHPIAGDFGTGPNYEFQQPEGGSYYDNGDAFSGLGEPSTSDFRADFDVNRLMSTKTPEGLFIHGDAPNTEPTSSDFSSDFDVNRLMDVNVPGTFIHK